MSVLTSLPEAYDGNWKWNSSANNWWQSSSEDSVVTVSAYSRDPGSSFSWYRPQKPYSRSLCEQEKDCESSRGNMDMHSRYGLNDASSAPVSDENVFRDATSAAHWHADRDWQYNGGWWWSQSDAVHQNHMNGRRASYYAQPEKQSTRQVQLEKQSYWPSYSRGQSRPTGKGLSGSGTKSQSVGVTLARSSLPPRKVEPGAVSNYYIYMSTMNVDTLEQNVTLPPMSLDGGCEEEFQEYWRRNRSPRRLDGGWIERVAHPQVNIETYWYNMNTGDTVWTRPRAEEIVCERVELEPLTGDGPVWELSVKDLKTVLRDGLAQDYGLKTNELAKRAVAEFEKFEPRVLSWHDYQYITFWFFGGLDKKDKKDKDQDPSKNAKSFFGPEAGDGRDMFADDAFFHATGDILMKRMHLMHPINLTYMVWTYSRANVVIPSLMTAIAQHFCDGLLPMLDRCSLGTMVWNFAHQGIRLDRYFEDSAQELSRPNRLRSLAPRNFQNSMIAYSRRRHWNEKLVDAMARGIPRLLDNHDPRFPKTATNVLFSYTCRDGSEVPADAFRIGSCTVIAKAFNEIRASGTTVDDCLTSMLDYVLRSVERSPPMMREPGDACGFVRQLAYIAEGGRLNVAHHFSQLNFRRICEGAPEKNVLQMVGALRRCGIQADVGKE